jgi:hypothetical protein
MKKTALAPVLAAGAAVCLLVVPTASAANSLHVRISTKVPSPGDVVHVKATNAHPGESYACVLSIGHRNIGSGATSLADVNSAVIKTANDSGVVRCGLTFERFTGTYKDKTHYCPPSRKDKAHNWYCGAAVANLSNYDEHGIGKFDF